MMKINIAGVEFKNPVMTASGTCGLAGFEFEDFYPLSTLGGIICKAVSREARTGNPIPRAAETASGMLNAVGLQNEGIDKFLTILPMLAKKGTNIIANAVGRTVEDYIYVVERLNESLVDMIELNISCPNVKEGGVAFGVYPKGVEDIVTRVKKSCKKPLIIKLSPNVADIRENAKAAEAAGADAISLINTLTGMAINYKTRRPIIANVTGGLSGPAIKPVALRMVWQAASAVKIPVIGLGGISTWQDALEFLIAGAAAVQIGTANMVNPMAAKQAIDGLENYFKENNLTISDAIGSLIT